MKVCLKGRPYFIRELTGEVKDHGAALGSSVELYGAADKNLRWWAQADSVEPLDDEAKAILLPLRAIRRLLRGELP